MAQRPFIPACEPLEPIALCSGFGYSPAAIRHAYGFDAAAHRLGLAARGEGVTIAIVDAYHDPRIIGEVAAFSRANGLPPADLTVVNLGGTGDTAGLLGWSLEEALDVETIHGLLPRARIVLVEASSPTTDDMAAAESYASSIPGVAAVSNSWGARGLDPYTATTLAAGFANSRVVYAAAAGDASGPIDAPASLPGVISVGGTVLRRTSHGWRNRPWLRYTTPPDVRMIGGYPGLRAFGHEGFMSSSRWWDVWGTSLACPAFAAEVGAADGVRIARGGNPLGTAEVLAGIGIGSGLTPTVPGLIARLA